MEQVITENHNHLMELLGAFLTGVVGPVLYLIVSKYMANHKDKKRDKVRETIVNTNLINDELEEIREEFKSDRVWISQFHNGGNFYPTGKSIQKFSIFYEVTKAGVSSVSHTFNNIPTSLYPKAFDHMLNGEQKGIFINDFYDPKVATYGLKGAAESVGTKSSYVIPMFTLDEKFVGSLGLDYVGRKRKLTKSEWEHLQIKAGRIAGYISSYLEK
jgi:GAF domain-containing protein